MSIVFCSAVGRYGRLAGVSVKTTLNQSRWAHKEANIDKQAAYCMDLVRKSDYENFLATLLLPKSARTSGMAVRALNVELSQVRDVVSDKQIGLMRLQFWKDTLDRIYQGTPPETPVAAEVYKALKRHKLSKQWFSRLIEAREENIRDTAYRSIDDVESYADTAFTPVNYLILECLGVRDVQADHAASHVGKAQGLVALLRGIPHHAGQRRVLIPVEVLLEHGVSQEDVIRGCREQKMKDVVYDVASAAKQQLETARSMIPNVPKPAFPAFLTTAACDAYLKSIQRVDFDVFDPRLYQRNNWLPLTIFLQKLKNTY